MSHPPHNPDDHRDGLTTGPLRGRGAGINPGNRFEDIRLHVLADHLNSLAEERGLDEHGQIARTSIATHVQHDDAHTVLNHVQSPDLGFEWTLNPYRGCEHGCIYCYARPGHEYFGLSLGVDFETRLFAKHDAPQLLRKELMRDAWSKDGVRAIMISGVTDPYQPIERDLEITRKCLEVCLEFRQPVSIITKNALLLRDLDLFTKMHEYRGVRVAVSITTLDNSLASIMEPRASAPRARLDAVRAVAATGIPVCVMAAPIIPAINDAELPAILEAAKSAGASHAGYILLRLPYQIKNLFLDWLRRHFPDRAAKVESLIRQTHHGELYDSKWFERQRGEGPIADQINATFTVFARKHGLDSRWSPLNTSAFRKPGGQLDLFGTV